MNFRFLILSLALGLLAAGGCAAGPKVVTDFDPIRRVLGVSHLCLFRDHGQRA